MTDKEKLEKVVAYIEDAKKYYVNNLEKGNVGDFGGKLAAIYDIELYMAIELKIPMEV